jgi:hypothetical protein
MDRDRDPGSCRDETVDVVLCRRLGAEAHSFITCARTSAQPCPITYTPHHSYGTYAMLQAPAIAAYV